jgi:hypothetical protein
MDAKHAKDSSLVERWIEDQREWQKTAMTFLDSMVKNDDFLVHLGNAMRGSLLAGKPYPAATAAAPPASQDPPADDRLDRVLFAVHELQGQLNDLRLTLEEMRPGTKAVKAPRTRRTAAPRKKKAVRSRKSGRARG